MVWFEMTRLWSWVIAVPKYHFNMSKKTNLNVWFLGVLEKQEAAGIYFFSSDWFISQPYQTKPYHTKSRHFDTIFGPFWPFFWSKYQKVNGFDLRTHIPWTNWSSKVEKYWSHPLTNSKNIFLVRQTCDWGFCTSLAHGDTVLVIIVSPNWVQVSHGKVRDTQTETIEQTWLTKNYTVTNQDVI